MTKCLSFLCAFFLTHYIIFSQYSTLGTQFWVTWMPNFDSPENCYLYITSETGATGTISMPGTGWSQNFTVAPNGSYTLQIPSAQNPVVSTINTPVNRAVRVTSNNPIAVYMANQRVASTDASIVLPVTALGDEYVVTAYTPFASTQPTQVAIIGVENGTSIQIIPSAALIGSVGAGVPLNITLNAGQVYVIQSTGDLTGTRIKATNANQCNNFAVFAGNKCAMVPTTCSYCDHLIEQMIPLKAWGQTFITTPLLTRNGDQFRIVASENGTQVQIDNLTPVNLNAGQYYEVYLQQASYITSNKPISVAQYSRGTTCDGASSDPFMIILSPIEQTLQHIVFFSFQAGNVTTLATNIVTKTANTSLVTLDGAAITGWNTVPFNPAYSFARRTVTQGSHVLHSDSGIVAIVYGYGNVESYGYLAGANIQPLQVTFYIIVNNDTIPYNQFNQQLDCNNQTVSFWVPTNLQLTNIHWNFGDGTTGSGNYVSHTYTTGNYVVTMYYQRYGSCYIDSLQMNVSVMNTLPPIQFPPDTFFCNSTSTLILNATIPGATQYTWNVPNNGPTLLVTTSGTYSVTASDQYGCSSSASITVEYVNLQVSIQKTDVSCQGFSDGTATAIVNGGTGPYQYIWNTTPVQTTQNINNLAAGTYSVTVTEGHGCTATASVQIIDGSLLQITAQGTDVSCYGYSDGSAQVTVQNGVPPYTCVWNTQPVQYGMSVHQLPAGIYIVSVTDSQGCGGTASVVIGSPPALIAEITYVTPAGCEGILGQITAFASGGTPPYSYQWNTLPVQTGATAQNLPAGTYVVTVTDNRGCSANAEATYSVIGFTVEVEPSHCARADGAALVNVFEFTGNYNITWSNGQIGPMASQLPAGMHSVTVTDAAGSCVQMFQVAEISGPSATMTITPILAEVGQEIYFNGYAPGVNTFIWNFGDGTITLGSEVTHIFHEAGLYTVCLKVIDEYECENEVCKQIVINDVVTFYIPNSFSPNGDGMNDEFVVKGIGIDPDNFVMKIYNRWGEKLYESRCMNKGWDGTYQGKLVPAGIYTYFIEYRDFNGVERQFRGIIILYY